MKYLDDIYGVNPYSRLSTLSFLHLSLGLSENAVTQNSNEFSQEHHPDSFTNTNSLPLDKKHEKTCPYQVLSTTLPHYIPIKHVRCNPDVAPRLTSSGYEDKVDVITPTNKLFMGVANFDPS